MPERCGSRPLPQQFASGGHSRRQPRAGLASGLIHLRDPTPCARGQRPVSEKAAITAEMLSRLILTQCMVRPCVARGFRRSVGCAVLHQCIRPQFGACAPGHHGYQRACVLISGPASSGPFGSPGFACAGKTVLHLVSSSRRPRQARCLDLTTSSWAPHFCAIPVAIDVE